MRRTDSSLLSTTFHGIMSGSSAATADIQGPLLVGKPDGSSYLVNGKLVFTFNEPISWGTGRLSIGTGSSTVFAGPTYMNTEVWISGNTLTVTPTAPLQYATTYTVMFSHDAVKDSAGNNLPGDSAYPLVFEFTTVASPPAVNRTGTSGYDTLYGSDFADTLNGAGGGDYLFGLAGDDTLDGDGSASGAERDKLDGGAGNDTLRGGAGNDVLLGGSGDDRLEGGIGDDYLNDDEGRNTLIGGDGDDSLYSVDGATGSFDGGEGKDQLWGPDGVDMVGGNGDDTINISLRTARSSRVEGGAGNDTLQVVWRNQTDAQVTLSGGAGLDTFGFTEYSAPGAGMRLRITDFTAGAGGDLLKVQGMLPSGYTGNPFVEGLLRLATQGSDTVLQRPLPGETSYLTMVELTGVRPEQLVAANFVGGIDPGGSTRGLTLIGTAGGDTLLGGMLDDTLQGLDGDDLLNGNTGNDLLEGGWGNDELRGDEGDDRLDGGEQNDKLYGGNGSDHLVGGSGDDRLDEVHTLAGHNLLEGGGGSDTLHAQSHGSNVLDGGDGDDDLWSGGGNNTLLGGDGNDKLRASSFWNDENVVLDGGAGQDELRISAASASVTMTARGGSGADVFVLEQGDGSVTITDFTAADGDQLDLWMLYRLHLDSNPFGSSGYLKMEQSGSDVLIYADSDGAAGKWQDFKLAATLTGVDLATLGGAQIVGGYHPNGSETGRTITGTAGNDKLAGGAGDDTLRGLGGFDRIDGGAGNDLLEGGDDDDVLSDEAGGGLLDGGAGDDRIVAGEWFGDRYLTPSTMRVAGGAGDDDIYAAMSVAGIDGGAGNDSIELFAHGGADDAQALRIEAGDGDDRLVLTGGKGTAPVEAAGGGGQDTYRFDSFTQLPLLTVTDFQAGAGGDVLDVSQVFYGTFGKPNPFGTDWNMLRMVQRGDDAVLQRSGALTGTPDLWIDTAVLRNTTVAALTSENFSDGLRLDGSQDGWDRTGTAAADEMRGGRMKDRLRGGDGNDEIFGSDGDDVLYGDGGDDYLSGGAGNNTLWGGDGNDELDGVEGNDRLEGGAGNDKLYARGAGAILNGGDGNDYLSTAGTSAVLDGGDGDDDIRVSWLDPAPDAKLSFAVHGGAGQDSINIQAAQFAGTTVVADGGAGSDTYIIETRQAGSIRILDFQPGEGGDVLDLTRLLWNTWNDATPNPFAEGSMLKAVQRDADTVIQLRISTEGAGSYEDLLTLENVSKSALGAANIAMGFNPDGTLQGRTIAGTADADEILGGWLGDSIDGGAGNDILWGGVGDDRLLGGDGNDSLDGDFQRVFHVPPGFDTGESGNDVLEGGAGDDQLSSSWGSDLLRGGDGNDTLTVRSDLDVAPAAQATMAGDAGDDVFVVHESRTENHKSIAAVATGGAGRDLFVVSPQLYAVTDFQAGAGGDLISLSGLPIDLHATPDPFGKGYLRLVQDGADARLQFDPDGAGRDAGFETVLVLNGVNVANITAANFSGGVPIPKPATPPGVPPVTPPAIPPATPPAIPPATPPVTPPVVPPPPKDSSGTSGGDQLTGGAGNDRLDGGEGSDLLVGGAGDDTLIGGAGLDSARYAGSAADYTVVRTADGFRVLDKRGTNGDGSDTLAGVERIAFADGALALDVDGVAGQAFRIYRAAFDRAPDQGGMGFWLSVMDKGASVHDMAVGFAASKEFADLYGAAPTNAELVMRMYKNILHREPDPAGYAYWLDILDSKKADLPGVLALISESGENLDAVAELIANGIPYTPWG
jgi:Ca2+-binding RTX toxin-like protein